MICLMCELNKRIKSETDHIGTTSLSDWFTLSRSARAKNDRAFGIDQQHWDDFDRNPIIFWEYLMKTEIRSITYNRILQWSIAIPLSVTYQSCCWLSNDYSHWKIRSMTNDLYLPTIDCNLLRLKYTFQRSASRSIVLSTTDCSYHKI